LFECFSGAALVLDAGAAPTTVITAAPQDFALSLLSTKQLPALISSRTQQAGVLAAAHPLFSPAYPQLFFHPAAFAAAMTAAAVAVPPPTMPSPQDVAAATAGGLLFAAPTAFAGAAYGVLAAMPSISDPTPQLLEQQQQQQLAGDGSDLVAWFPRSSSSTPLLDPPGTAAGQQDADVNADSCDDDTSICSRCSGCSGCSGCCGASSVSVSSDVGDVDNDDDTDADADVGADDDEEEISKLSLPLSPTPVLSPPSPTIPQLSTFVPISPDSPVAAAAPVALLLTPPSPTTTRKPRSPTSQQRRTKRPSRPAARPAPPPRHSPPSSPASSPAVSASAAARVPPPPPSISDRARNYLCRSCGKLFLRKQDLVRHGATHMDPSERPHLCPNGCGRSFGRADAAHRHSKASCKMRSAPRTAAVVAAGAGSGVEAARKRREAD
ncbi:hypothetical protein HK405_016092, partial [Cladochytrium tenue]